jgi:hypothetical protein
MLEKRRAPYFHYLKGTGELNQVIDRFAKGLPLTQEDLAILRRIAGEHRIQEAQSLRFLPALRIPIPPPDPPWIVEDKHSKVPFPFRPQPVFATKRRQESGCLLRTVSHHIRGSFQGTAQVFQDSLSSEPILILTAIIAVYTSLEQATQIIEKAARDIHMPDTNFWIHLNPIGQLHWKI